MPRTFVALALLMLMAPACGDGTAPAAGDGRLTVVANFYPVAEAAARVGGDRVEVVDLTPPGVEPHDLELTSRQVDQIEDADLLVYVGGGFQPAVEEAAARRDGPSIDLLDRLPSAGHAEAEAKGADEHGHEHGDDEADEHGHEHGGDVADEHGHEHGEAGSEQADEHGHEHGDGADPHFWLDPTLLAAAAEAVAGALAEVAADPGAGAAFEANAAAYVAELEALDEELAARLAGCERRTIVTSHAAFHHLARRYNLEQRAISGLSPEAEPDPQRLADLADLIREEGITTVFYETLVAPDVAETLAREVGVGTAVLNPIEGLTKEQHAAGADYAAVMRDNLAALTAALACP